MEIRELQPPNETGYCYAEGYAPMVDILDGTPGMGGWFTFEEPWAKTCMLLQGLGFTATQILEARDQTVREGAEDAALDDRPWGEQQGQVDWLESRFDDPMEDGPNLYDYEGD
jgi:hypothetical protein